MNQENILKSFLPKDSYKNTVEVFLGRFFLGGYRALISALVSVEFEFLERKRETERQRERQRERHRRRQRQTDRERE